MSGRRVLVVDDEPRILDIVRYFLEQGGWQVEAFPTGAKGLQAARKSPFDVAVLDIVLGRGSGYDVAGRLKTLPGSEETPVLFMSSKVEMAGLFMDHYDGRAEFIRKPFKKDDLLAQVAALASGGGRRGKARES
jgi:DNA-binding response OmpR family regulator